MKRIKLYMLLSGISFSISLFANTVPPCPLIGGFYSGTYQDTTGLFPNQAFPINTYLTYHNGMLYGYTLNSKDKMGAKYGSAPYALIWGTCNDNKLTNLYVIKRSNKPCGDPSPGPMILTTNSPLNITINYENAMINANLATTLSPNATQNNLLNQGKISPNQKLIYEAIGMATTGIQTCH